MKHLGFNGRLRLWAMAGFVLCFGSAMAQDDLQEYVNRAAAQRGANRAPSDITVVDLSQFSATNRSVTLDVANGRNFRFINGTLTRAESLDGPILHVGGGSYVEIADGCSISARSSRSLREAVVMDGGELVVTSTGAVLGSEYYNSQTQHYPTSVLMTADGDVLCIEGTVQNSYTPTIDGPVVCEAPNASLTYRSGYVFEGAHNTGGVFISAADIRFENYPLMNLVVTLTGKDNVVDLGEVDPPLMKVSAPNKASRDVVVRASRSWIGSKQSWGERIQWTGNSKYTLVADAKASAIRLSYDDLQDWINDPDDRDRHCGCRPEDPYTVDVYCEGMTAKSDVEFPEDDLYWFINGQPEGQTDEEAEADCEKTIDEGENDVNVRPGSTLYIRGIHWKGCGCRGKHIWVWGTLHIRWRVWFYYYWRFIHVMPGGRVVIDDLYGECDETVFHLEDGEADYNSGDCTGGQYGWHCEKGEFNMNGGKLTGGTCGGWTGKDGRSRHNDGTVCGGIHNYGWHYWYGGRCTGGGSYTIYNHKGGHFYYYGGTCTDNGKIWNEGDLYIDGGGSVSCGDIYCVRGGCIYILRKLTFIIRLVFTEENIVSGETVVVGGDGYKLTQDDVDRIQIVLPDGYEWRYDGPCGCIAIYKTSGVAAVGTDQPAARESYNAAGRKAGEGEKGLNIQRMTDGTVRKTVAK